MPHPKSPRRQHGEGSTPGHPMDRETLTRAIARLESRVADEPEHNGYQSAIDDLKTFALEQLRDAAQIAQQPSRSELMRHAVQRGGRPMDVAALPAPVGGQTPTESPQDIENAKLTRILEIERRQYERLNLCPDHRDKASGRCIVCDGERRGRENAAAPPPPGAPPADPLGKFCCVKNATHMCILPKGHEGPHGFEREQPGAPPAFTRTMLECGACKTRMDFKDFAGACFGCGNGTMQEIQVPLPTEGRQEAR